MKSIQLSRDEWVEISCSVETKIGRILAGAYWPEDRPGDNTRWLDELHAILDKIGPDGTTAAAVGVAPSDG